MNKDINDPRRLLADKLYKADIDLKKSFFIALDAGRNLVNKEYLIDFGLRGEQLITAESLVQEFYWENSSSD